ncbi:hypothetical protein LZ32DRAFT_415785 [Colletotrichum eremochloae]|nr:hypothetical protein LZ32DRAFT_415785 [Colletotrichum eremochloae]
MRLRLTATKATHPANGSCLKTTNAVRRDLEISGVGIAGNIKVTGADYHPTATIVMPTILEACYCVGQRRSTWRQVRQCHFLPGCWIPALAIDGEANLVPSATKALVLDAANAASGTEQRLGVNVHVDRSKSQMLSQPRDLKPNETASRIDAYR